ncbi:MAG TPA: hypothetical protein VF456_19595, partial [Vicinamibacterales bacterium]
MTLLPVKAVRTLLLVVVACAVQACHGQTSPTAPLQPSPIVPADWLQIVSISPAAGTALEPGTTVSIDLTARYNLTSMDRARIALGLVDQESYSLQPSGDDPIVEVSRGEADIHFSMTVQMPARSITLYVGLFPLDG